MFFIILILMVMFIMVITLEVTSMITCGQMVAAMTLICSTRDASPVSLATRASGLLALHLFSRVKLSVSEASLTNKKLRKAITILEAYKHPNF